MAAEEMGETSEAGRPMPTRRQAQPGPPTPRGAGTWGSDDPTRRLPPRPRRLGRTSHADADAVGRPAMSSGLLSNALRAPN